MSGRRLGGRRPASGDVLGDFLRDALPGHVHREALSGPPGRALSRQIAPCHWSTAGSPVVLTDSEFRRCPLRAPGRIPWGESAPGHGKAPWSSARGGTGVSGRLLLSGSRYRQRARRFGRPFPRGCARRPWSARARRRRSRDYDRSGHLNRCPHRQVSALLDRDEVALDDARGRAHPGIPPGPPAVRAAEGPHGPRRPAAPKPAEPPVRTPGPVPPPAGVSAPRPGRSRARRRPCRSGGGGRCGSPAP
ncbi:hypothetical protein SAMN05428944_4977 [Streptomyces sp. 1222.5]|nr:hypothetical protein BX260_3120 [Streptomyces sp. 5112.2]SEC76061.1 hypothetical protein SAMN05428944_4977 [Streptomyces sp. 1222.5]